jgi:DNA-directed RNA polymerase subunit M
MKFCDACGSYMEMTARGYSCPRCGNEVRADEIEVRRMKDSPPEGVYVVNKSEDDSPRLNQTCPRCGYHEAFHHISMISGEHAGVKQERTVERYRCARCFYSWTQS